MIWGCTLQVHGRGPITAAISHLTGPAKKAASEAFEKVAASKGGAAALQGAGPASEDSQMAPRPLAANAGSRPSSRGATEAPVRVFPHTLLGAKVANQMMIGVSGNLLPSSMAGPSSGSCMQVASPRHSRSAASSAAEEAAGPGASGCLAVSTKKEERARRFRGKAGKFEAPGEDEEELLEAELGPLASEGLRCRPTVLSILQRWSSSPLYYRPII